MIDPLVIVALSVGVIALSIAVLRLHAFLALMAAAVLVALLSAKGALGTAKYAHAIGGVMNEFGAAAGKIGFAIALAALIGAALMRSGAADRIVGMMIDVAGETNASVGLLVCSLVLAAPVFVDTVFLLMLPIARALSVRTGRNLLLNVLVIGLGAAITNGLIPPAPGPLLVAETLKINLGHAIVGGMAFALLPAVAAYFLAQWFNSHVAIPLRIDREEAAALAQGSQEREDRPGFWLSAAPIVVPLLLIAVAAFLSLAGKAVSPLSFEVVQLLGEKNVALGIGAVIAWGTLLRRSSQSRRQIMKEVGAPLEAAGMIIMIVAAGGAYGAMIKGAGVGDEIRVWGEAHSLDPVLLAWCITAMIRGALGSATVATITGVGIMAAVLGPGAPAVNPLYILAAIGFGSKCLPWMNDAAFWVVSRLSGLTQGEMLRTWSPASSLISVLGLGEVLLCSKLWPHLPL